MRLVSITPDDDGTHKFRAVFEYADGRTKTTHFGAKGYSDFTQHKNRLRKANYLARHRYREDWNDPTTAGALSRWILWNLPTMTASVADFKRRFNL